MFARFSSFWLVLFLISTFTLAAETYFEIIDHEENSVFGTIAALDRTQIAADVQGTIQTIPLEKVINIRNLAPSPYEGASSTAAGSQILVQQSLPAAAGRGTNDRRLADALAKRLQSNEQALKKTFPGSVVVLELKDGSQLTASSFTVTKDQGVCRLLEQQNNLSIPLNHISAVQFTVRNLPEVNNPSADWLRLAVPNTEGDRLVVGNPGAFDVYTGILGDINAETISFTVDGEVLSVPRRRVFGLVLHGNSPPLTGAPPFATLTLWSGTQGRVSDIRLAENELTWQSGTGLTVTVPLDMVSEIDFGEKGMTYLIDFDRVRSDFSLPFESQIKPEPLKLFQTFYESRTQTSREMILDGTVYERGITLLGKTTLEYHLPKPFAALKAVIGIEDQFRPHAAASLQILVDSQVLGTWELRGDSASQRINVNLPQNCRLITIIAEPLPQSVVPAVLTIADPKLFE